MVLTYSGEADGNEVLAKLSYLPREQIEFVPQTSLETVRELERGIVFLMAFWSGYATRSFATLTKELARFDTNELRLIVCDVDGADELQRLPEIKGMLTQGEGNIFWIQSGLVVTSSRPSDGHWDRLELKHRVSELRLK